MTGYLGLELLFPVALIGLIVLGLVSLGANRREADVGGSRALALYLSTISFIALFTLVFAGSFAATSFASIPLDDRPSSNCFVNDFGEQDCFGGSGVDATDEHVSQGTMQALIALAALGVLLFHLRRMKDLSADPAFGAGPGRATLLAFAYAVCFVAMTTLLVAGSLAAFSALKVVAPGTFGNMGDTGVDRNDGVLELIAAALPALVAYGLFRWQWGRAQALRRAGEGAV